MPSEKLWIALNISLQLAVIPLLQMIQQNRDLMWLRALSVSGRQGCILATLCNNIRLQTSPSPVLFCLIKSALLVFLSAISLVHLTSYCNEKIHTHFIYLVGLFKNYCFFIIKGRNCVLTLHNYSVQVHHRKPNWEHTKNVMWNYCWNIVFLY